MSYKVNKKATVTMTFDEHELTSLWLALDLKAKEDLKEYNHVFRNTKRLFDMIDQASDELNKSLDAE